MVSGALLLPIKETTMMFLRKRLKKILYPVLFWSLFYIICNLWVGKMNFDELGRVLLNIPFSAQGNSVLWFMYTLTGLYLLAPILSAWLEKADKKIVEGYLVLWTITLCYPFLNIVLQVPEGEENTLFYFSGYAGYFVLGYYLNNYPQKIISSRKYYLICALGLLIVFIPPILCKLNYLSVNFYSLFWYLSIGVVMMCVGWFILFQRVRLFQQKSTFNSIVVELSKISFGIYLIHIFIMRYILWNWDILQSLPYVLQIPFCTLLTLGLSYLVIKVISKFSFSKYIIGC